ncbi:MAG: DUF47 family protein [Clostridiaceae bacterium]|nr:DUF47 family protein [Clostridiaceae bacterium]
MRKPVNFFHLLSEQSDYLLLCMKKLHEYCCDFDDKTAEEIISLEDDADMVRHIMIDEINRTFITPLNREDLFNLSRLLDDIIDYAKTSVDEIRLFKLSPNQDMKDMTQLLYEMASHIKKAVQNMEHYRNIAESEAFHVKRMENEVGKRSYSALATLFEHEDFRTIFKYREIYRHLNHTADIADAAMDYLLDILVKM